MRDTRDRWRCRPAAPCRYRPRRPAGLPPAQRAEHRQPTLQEERSSTTMPCKATGEEDALSGSGPLRPALKGRSWRLMFGLQACPARPVAADSNLYRLAGREQRLCNQIVDEIG